MPFAESALFFENAAHEKRRGRASRRRPVPLSIIARIVS
jgi:hypothetical protein